MILEWGPTFRRDYKALNAASKMRVEVTLRRLVAGHPQVETVIVDFRDLTEAAIVDDFLCITFQRRMDGFLLLNVRSIDITRR